MEFDDGNISDDTEFLTLKERILLLQNKKKENAVKSVSPASSSLKRIHSVSDSEESDSNKKDYDNEFELPPLSNSPCLQKVILLSDSEDEVKDVCEAHKVKETIKYSEEDIFLLQYPVDKSDNSAEIEKPSKATKRLKKSPSKCVKDLDKKLMKQEKLKLREEKKREQELAKAIKQSEKELQKSKKPDECLKAMRVVIDHNLIMENGSQDIFCALDEGNVKYAIEENPISLSVAWCKTIVDVTVENNQVLKEEREEFENNMVVLIPNDAFVKMVHAFMQKSKGKDTNETILSDYIVNISSLFPQMNVTCTVLGLDKYLRTLKESESCDFELKKMARQSSKVIIEDAMVEVQLQTSVNFVFVNTMREFGDMLFRFTKAIAEAPQKKEKQMQKDLAFSWYADNDSSCPVKLGKERSSFIKLWQQQLQQFQNVGQETAEAIAAMYSSPQSLRKAYKQCSSKKEAEGLLKDIVVRRNYGPLGTQRRIGPELSYKIHLFLSTEEGNQILQR